MDISIIQGRPEDAPLIAQAIVLAIGEELTGHLAGEKHTRNDVLHLFESLARRNDSQYSFRNSLVALTPEGDVAGVSVSYDGADLHRLRRPFFEEAEESIGLRLDGEPDDETGPEEIYLDTVTVFNPYRGKGVAQKLIGAALEKARKAGKPLGLLVSRGNPEARRLYDKLGFHRVGERPFAGEMMDHLQLSSEQL